MNTEAALQILDRNLQYTLWAFLIVFLLILLFISLRLRSRRKTFADYYREEIIGDQEKKAWTPYSPSYNQWPMVGNALFLSLLLSGFLFLLLCFTPLPFLDNFVTGHSWKVAPLRITQLRHDRFQQGFSLNGEVWNQTEKPIDDLLAVVIVQGEGGEVLDTLRVPVSPLPLPGGSAGTFSAEYREKSPFIRSYQIDFETSDGLEIQHATGFDVP